MPTNDYGVAITGSLDKCRARDNLRQQLCSYEIFKDITERNIEWTFRKTAHTGSGFALEWIVYPHPQTPKSDFDR